MSVDDATKAELQIIQLLKGSPSRLELKIMFEDLIKELRAGRTLEVALRIAASKMEGGLYKMWADWNLEG